MQRLILTIILSGAFFLFSGCKDPEPIRIGFLGDLTTRSAGLSISGRDGFLLAIEEVNAQGGIKGRKVEGLVQDTHTHKDSSIRAIHTLVDNQVSAIIGPMTSRTAVAIVPEINRVQVPLISPTVSTNMLNGLDDYFFRVYYSNAQAAELLAEQISAMKGRIAVIYDLANRAYTEDWVDHFQTFLEKSNESQIVRIPFELERNTLFLDLATQAADTSPKAILILANAVDTAMICQQLAKIGIKLPLYATGWSYSDDLIQFGGNSVEGLNVIQSTDLQNPSPSMQGFIEDYQKRFRSDPNFPALHAYDATRMILSILEETTDPQSIRKKLINLESFEGLQSDLSFDRYGDLKHPRIHLVRITNGQFLRAE